jgi:GDPmannose 4,6-dehydratase
MRALITGITGQDGRYLSELLSQKGYQVFGVVRDKNSIRDKTLNSSINPENLFQGNLTDYQSLVSVISTVKPDEIYNLASISHVVDSLENPRMSADANAIGPLNLLQAVVESGLTDKTRFYQASSSEMFGSIPISPQNEDTPYAPVSPYGIAKVFAHYTCRNYRDSKDMHASCGILYNHESPYRNEKFVSRKITKTVAEIALGRKTKLVLGNLEARRDWGFAGDYVEAMWLMLQQGKPDDYVICTGKTFTVRQFLEIAFSVVGIQDGIEKYVVTDPDLMRKVDVTTLVGDNSKAKIKLGWEPKVNLEYLIQMMIESDIRSITNQNRD